MVTHDRQSEFDKADIKIQLLDRRKQSTDLNFCNKYKDCQRKQKKLHIVWMRKSKASPDQPIFDSQAFNSQKMSYISSDHGKMIGHCSCSDNNIFYPNYLALIF
jgi:hypothetical protein